MSDPRFVPCARCGGEGELGNEYWRGRCDACAGSGVEEIEDEAVEECEMWPEERE